ncbi:hypothetical protein AAIR98_001471 [Elusimicrobium simillimum]|uniref:hypothetical protein n=1 Tax=Elusimicrobium simillimum TaxID=3143438 RepID=UPI003C7054BF
MNSIKISSPENKISLSKANLLICRVIAFLIFLLILFLSVVVIGHKKESKPHTANPSTFKYMANLKIEPYIKDYYDKSNLFSRYCESLVNGVKTAYLTRNLGVTGAILAKQEIAGENIDETLNKARQTKAKLLTIPTHNKNKKSFFSGNLTFNYFQKLAKHFLHALHGDITSIFFILLLLSFYFFAYWGTLKLTKYLFINFKNKNNRYKPN